MVLVTMSIDWLGSSYHVTEDEQFEDIRRWYSGLDESRKDLYTFYTVPKILTIHCRQEEAAFKLRWL